MCGRVREIKRRERENLCLWLIICSFSTHCRPVLAPPRPHLQFSPLYGFIKNANEQWRLQSWQPTRWGQKEKKQKTERKARTKTETQTLNLCQGFRDSNLLFPLGYIEYKGAFIIKIIQILSSYK